MAARRGVLVLSVALLALAACGSETPGPAVMVEPGITALQQARPLTCDADRKTLETAIEAYTLMNGAPPASEAALVGTMLRSAITTFDVAPDGSVVVAPGSLC
jgi:hypothetical protein